MEISGHIFHSDYSLPNSAEIMADPNLLYRAFENILKNAQNYCARGSTIELRSCLEGDRVVFLITDRGRGVSKEEQALIFEPFFRGDSSRNQGGMGLGQASTDFIIRNNGGTIEYKNHRGGGAEFHITLPLYQAVNQPPGEIV